MDVGHVGAVRSDDVSQSLTGGVRVNALDEGPQLAHRPLSYLLTISQELYDLDAACSQHVNGRFNRHIFPAAHAIAVVQLDHFHGAEGVVALKRWVALACAGTKDARQRSVSQCGRRLAASYWPRA